MQAILSVTVPFFALVLCGYWATRRGVLPEPAIPGLNAYVLFFALPCLLFKFGASMPFSKLIDPTLMAIYVVCAMVMVFVTISATLKSADDRFGIDLKNSAFGALVAAFPNTGFMGVPLLVALLGDAAAGPVVSTVLIDLILTSTFCIALAQSQEEFSPSESEPSTMRSSALRSLRAALTNPLPWSIALGALVAATEFKLPGPVNQVIQMLADSASPVALFTIGAVLWRASQAGQNTGVKTPVAQYLPVALLKLFVHPLLVLSVGVIAKALGAPVPAFGLTVLVLAAALPSASNVSLLAERYGADNGRIARIIMASTVMAFVSFSLLAWVLGAKPHAA
jgi:malonate transporter and related proteins